MFKGIVKLIHTKFGFILDLVAPRKCAGCGKRKESFCRLCIQKSFKIGAQCIFCGFRNNTGKFCKTCVIPRKTALKQILWASRYKEEIKKAILDLKYRKRKELSEPLGKIMTKKFKELYSDTNDFVVVPIPLHFKKEHERGFNQALLLAKEFGRETGIPVEMKILEKIKETKTQVETENKESRINNLENVFRANADLLMAYSLKSKAVILIDDVATTGATLIHAADALTQAGAKKIIGLVVAHG